MIRRNKRIKVTDLAYFYANESQFIENKGAKVKNKLAADIGTQYHNSIGSTPKIVLAGQIALLILGFAFFDNVRTEIK